MGKCSFCSKEIPAGTGKIYVLKDGTMFRYCSSKCENNHLKLKMKPQKSKWVKKTKKVAKK